MLKKSSFRQNLAVVLIYHLYYVLRHVFMQKKAILAKVSVRLSLHQADDLLQRGPYLYHLEQSPLPDSLERDIVNR